MLAATGTHVPARELRLAFRDQGQTARYDRHQDLARHLLHSGHAIRDLAFNLVQRKEENTISLLHRRRNHDDKRRGGRESNLRFLAQLKNSTV